MTREEAIADIRDNIKPVVGGKSLDMAIKALEQTRWIPCSERLPENDDDVLVTDDAGGLATVGIDWFDIYIGRWCCSQNVTAWMPLPEPYRGGESE